MKKSILSLTLFTFLTGAVFTSCNSSAEKLENAKNDVTEANKDLVEAEDAYLTDIENYKTSAREKTDANDKSIAEFKSRIANQKKEAKADYEKKIAELEQKNSDAKKKMDDYKADGKDKWELFKSEFNHDMEELGKAFKSLTVNDVK